MRGEDIKTIGVLTSGGDAPGMNAAIRAVVRQTILRGRRSVGIRRGYAGLLKEEIQEMTAHDVSDIISRGGTILQTARSKKMMEEEYQQMAADICKKHGIDALVVIGGDGSFRGAQAIARHGINIVGVPGTIDLDIACTDYTIGFDTAVNTAVDAVDKIRDTSSSHDRCSIIEVMGRGAGYIALWTAISSGAEALLMAETYDGDEDDLAKHIVEEGKKKGKTHFIIINAESIGDSMGLAERLEAKTGIETRATILGYMQRGGRPTPKDRVYATTMGVDAVDCLLEGKTNRVIGHWDGHFNDYDIDEALAMVKEIDPHRLKVCRDLGNLR